MVASFAQPRAREVSPIVVASVTGVIWWVVGFLPWILTGLNGSYFGPLFDATSASAVPVDWYSPTILIDFGFVGGLCAGGVWIVAGMAGRHVHRAGVAGILGAIAITFTQAGIALAADRELESRHVQALVLLAVVCAVGSFAGWGLGLALTRGLVWVSLTLAVLCTVGQIWRWEGARMSINLMSGTDGNLREGDGVYEIMSWHWVAVVAVVLIVIGARPVRRLALWPVMILVSWLAVVPGWLATSLVVQVAEGESALSADQYRTLLVPDGRALIGYSIAVVMAGLGAVVLTYWRPWRPAREQVVARPQQL